jgi:probable F420-dependent oxidoreductase
VICGLIAHVAPGLEVGTDVAQIGPRTIPSLASGAATVANVAPGRFTLGVGVSTRVIVEGWHGLTWKPPLDVATQSIRTLRSLLAGDASDQDGDIVRTKGYRLSFPPAVPPPIWLAAMNERMIEVAGAEADGAWLNLFTAEGVRQAAAVMGARAAGSGRPAPGIALSVLVHLTDDPSSTFTSVRRMLSFYMSAPPYRRSFARQGFDEEVEQGGSAFSNGDREGVRRAVSDRLIDTMTLIGSEDRIRAGIEEYFDAGVTHFVVSVLDQDGMAPTLEAVSRMIPELLR